eukprot:UN27641
MTDRGRKDEENAEKQLKRTFAFFDNKYEKAAEFYKSAGAKYKTGKNFEKAGICFQKSGDLFNDKCTDQQLEAVTQWKEAAKSFKKILDEQDYAERAQNCYIKAIHYYQDNNRFNQAGKLYEEIAKIYLEMKNVSKAIEAYEHSAECFNSDDDTSNANKRLLEAANHLATISEFEKAIKYYEKAARDSVDNNLLRWSVKNYLFAAGLCQLCLAAETDKLDEAQDKLSTYENMSEIFRDTREVKLINACLESMMKGEVDAFSKAVQDFDEISQLDRWSLIDY